MDISPEKLFCVQFTQLLKRLGSPHWICLIYIIYINIQEKLYLSDSHLTLVGDMVLITFSLAHGIEPEDICWDSLGQSSSS